MKNVSNRNIYKEKKFPMTVVIPTIGEKNLVDLITQIKTSSFVPNEIIIVYPTKEKVKKINHNFDNVKIIRSPKSGQVAQRSFGIEKAKNNYILQMDADLKIKKDTIKKLISSFKKFGPKVAVGPKMDFLNEANIKYRGVNFKKWKKIFKVFKGGDVNIVSKKDPFRYDCWFDEFVQPKVSGYTNILPGGCILFDKTYYKNFDFYPFSGKALGEDILNSIYFQNYGCKLYYEANSKIVHPEPGFYSYDTIKQLFNDLILIYKIKFLACRLAGGNVIRYHTWFCYYTFITIMKFMLKK